MNSFTEATGGNPFWANYISWYRTYELMNNNRTFYDHMRYQMSNNEVYASVFDRLKKDDKALLQFSRACINPIEPPAGWSTDFARLTLQPTPSVAGVLTLRELQEKANYSSLLDTYKNVVGESDVRAMDDNSFRTLEDKLYEQGVAFTEIHKLCRASKKSLEMAKVLLSLKGPDHA